MIWGLEKQLALHGKCDPLTDVRSTRRTWTKQVYDSRTRTIMGTRYRK